MPECLPLVEFASIEVGGEASTLSPQTKRRPSVRGPALAGQVTLPGPTPKFGDPAPREGPVLSSAVPVPERACDRDRLADGACVSAGVVVKAE